MGIFSSLIIIVACLVVSAFFSGAETSLLRLRRQDLEKDIEAKRGPAALAARDLLKHTSRLLVTILLGNNVANILAASVASALAISYLGPDIGILVSTILMTMLIFFFCEVLPKTLAAHNPGKVANVVALPLYLIHQILRPIHVLFDGVIDPFVTRVTGVSTDAGGSSSEELLRLARHSQTNPKGGVTPIAIIGAAADADSMQVTDIMVQRTQIVTYPLTIPPGDLLEELLQERYTRVPIYDETIDNILGVVHFKDLVQLVRDNGRDLTPILKNVLRVPERKPILTLLTDMQRAFVHVAIVKDEFGVTQGMVTQEDILEELVGEIRDEFDREELLTIRKIGPEIYQALGRVSVLDFNRESGWEIPAQRGDTLAGVVFNGLGHAPRRSETVTVPGYELTVVDTSGTRVTQVRVARVSEPAKDDEDGAGDQAED